MMKVSSGILGLMPYNSVLEVTSIQELKNIFPDGYDSNFNWLFVGMGGQHGTHYSLNDAEKIIAGRDSKHKAAKGTKFWVTVLVVQPRLCILRYGDIQVNAGDIAFLRQLVKNTVEAVKESQKENI